MMSVFTGWDTQTSFPVTSPQQKGNGGSLEWYSLPHPWPGRSGFDSRSASVTHYKLTPGQLRYLKRRHAQERDMETCCSCPGCETCKGFVRNCPCDMDMEGLHETLKTVRRESGRVELATDQRDSDKEIPF